jgi:hypothetical protein
MPIDNYVIIDLTNTVISIIGWDGSSPFIQPPNTQLIKFNGPAGEGWHWDGTKAVDPRPVPVPPQAPSVPQTVSPRQARLALIQSGLYNQVNTTINTSDQTTQVWWEFASTIDRQNPILIQVATQIGLQAYQIDALFILAATL